MGSPIPVVIAGGIFVPVSLLRLVLFVDLRYLRSAQATMPTAAYFNQ